MNISEKQAIVLKGLNDLLSSQKVSFEQVSSLKNVMGVYMIYSPLNELLYIGSTNKFHIRFGVDLKHETTHTLTRKIMNEYSKDRKEIKEYLINMCKYQVAMCDSKREAEAIEHLAIYLCDPRFNK